MSWVRFDDKAAFHRKLVTAGNEAVGAWMRMTCWCADQLTDGHVPRDIALLIAGTSRAEVLTKLCDVGLLDRNGDDYVVHDYLDTNPSREEIQEQRMMVSQARSEAGRRGAESRWQNGKRDGKDDDKPITKNGPVPSRPDPYSTLTPARAWAEAWSKAGLPGLAQTLELANDGDALKLDPLKACETYKAILAQWRSRGVVVNATAEKMRQHLPTVQQVMRGEIKLTDLGAKTDAKSKEPSAPYHKPFKRSAE